METIIASVISAAGAVVVCMINSSHQAKTTRNLIHSYSPISSLMSLLYSMTFTIVTTIHQTISYVSK